MKTNLKANGWTITVISAVIAVVAVLLFALPQYGVWQQSLEGKAELMKADYTRQVAVVEAQAQLDAAEKLKQVAVIKAEGIAKANAIIGESLKNNPEYLTYLQIESIEKGAAKGNKTYFVSPSQGGLPIVLPAAPAT